MSTDRRTRPLPQDLRNTPAAHDRRTARYASMAREAVDILTWSHHSAEEDPQVAPTYQWRRGDLIELIATWLGPMAPDSAARDGLAERVGRVIDNALDCGNADSGTHREALLVLTAEAMRTRETNDMLRRLNA